jgi:hypothetical protein
MNTHPSWLLLSFADGGMAYCSAKHGAGSDGGHSTVAIAAA